MKKIILFCLFGLLLTAGCANMSNREQRVVSGVAVGGTVAGLPGAAIGALTGYFVHMVKSKDNNSN